VGLVQREIEAAGMSTIVLSSIPDLTAAVGAPRVAAIEYPLGLLLGQPGDKEGQRAVLWAALEALEAMTLPGSVHNLPFEWPESTQTIDPHPPEQPPITAHILRHPWLLRRLLSREVPASPEADSSGRDLSTGTKAAKVSVVTRD
jgi:hypothetical protein